MAQGQQGSTPRRSGRRSIARACVAAAVLAAALLSPASAAADFPSRLRRRRHLRGAIGERQRPALQRPDDDLGRADEGRRQRDPAPRPRLGPRRALSADRRLPRLGRLEDRDQRTDPGLGRKRLRGLQHERPRLGQLLRRLPTPTNCCPQMRQGLQPPDGRPHRSARRPVPDLRARRRRRGRAAENRRDRLLLRRRDVDGAGRAARPDDAARRLAGPLDQPGRQADGDRRRGPAVALDRPGLLADAQRAQPRLRRRLHLYAGRKANTRSGSGSSRSRASSTALGLVLSNYAAARHRPGGGPDQLVHPDQRRRALRSEPGNPRNPRRDHRPPLLVLHRSQPSRRRRS